MNETMARDSAPHWFFNTLAFISCADERIPLSRDARELLRYSITPRYKDSIQKLLERHEYESGEELSGILALFVLLLARNDDEVLLQRRDLDEEDQDWEP